MSFVLSLFGLAAPAGGGTGIPGTVAYRAAERTKDQSIARLTRDPQTEREIERFERALESAASPADLLKNRDARRVLLGAFGLGSELENTVLATRVLTSNPTDPRSDVSRLSVTNPNWMRANRELSFPLEGLSRLRDPGYRDIFVKDYIEQKWRDNQDRLTPGLGAALNFKERAPGLTSTLALLGDRSTREVIMRAFNIPQQIALQPLSSQVSTFERFVTPEKLQNPKFLDRVIERYLINVGGAGVGGGLLV